MFENSGHSWNLPEQLAGSSSRSRRNRGAAVEADAIGKQLKQTQHAAEADASGEQQLKRMQAGSAAASGRRPGNEATSAPDSSIQLVSRAIVIIWACCTNAG